MNIENIEIRTSLIADFAEQRIIQLVRELQSLKWDIIIGAIKAKGLPYNEDIEKKLPREKKTIICATYPNGEEQYVYRGNKNVPLVTFYHGNKEVGVQGIGYGFEYIIH